MAQLSFTREVITPAKAKQLVEHTIATGFTNRRITTPFAKRYMNDMLSGNWHPDTGETIKIDTQGAVIDGQHRLEAIIMSDTEQPIWVCRGIDRDMFQYLDQGKPRDLQDIMVTEHWPEPTVLATMGKMWWRYCQTQKLYGEGNPFAHAGSFNESDGAIYDWLLTVSPGIRGEWESHKGLVGKAYSGIDRAVPKAMLFYLLYLWKQYSAPKALEVFTYFSDPDNQASPDKACGWAVKYCRRLRQMQREQGIGGTKGRHGDAKESMLIALNLMWDAIHGKETIRSWSGFRNAVENEGGFRVTG